MQAQTIRKMKNTDRIATRQERKQAQRQRQDMRQGQRSAKRYSEE